MNVELIDVSDEDARALVAMEETPFPGDEVQLGEDGPVLRVIRRRYVFGNQGVLKTVQVHFRSSGGTSCATD